MRISCRVQRSSSVKLNWPADTGLCMRNFGVIEILKPLASGGHAGSNGGFKSHRSLFFKKVKKALAPQSFACRMRTSLRGNPDKES